MAIYVNDSFQAAANVGFPVAGVPSFQGQAGFKDTGITDEGAGVTKLTLDTGVDMTARTVTVTPKGAAAAFVTYEDVDDENIRVRAFDAAGAPLDNVAFAVQVMRHSL